MKRRSEELNEYLTTIKNENVLLGKLLYKLNNQLSSFKCYQYSKEIEKLLNRSIKEIEQWKTPTIEVMESMNDTFITIINKIEDLGLDLMALVNLNYHLQFGCMVISMMSRIHTCLKGAYAIIEERIAEKRSTLKKTESVVTTEGKKSATTVATTATNPIKQQAVKPVVENKPSVAVAEKKTTTAMIIEEKKVESAEKSIPQKPVEMIVEEKHVEEVKEEVKVVEVEKVVEQEIKPAQQVQEEEVKLEQRQEEVKPEKIQQEEEIKITQIQIQEEIIVGQKPEEVIEEVQKEVEMESQQKPQEEKKAEPINTEARGIIGASYLAEHPVESEKKSKVSEVKPLIQEINLGGQPENQMSIKIAEMKINTLFVSKQRDRRKLQNTAIAIEPVVQPEEPPQEEKVQEPVEEKEEIKTKPAGFSYSDIQQDLQKELGIKAPVPVTVPEPELEPIQIEEEEAQEAEVEVKDEDDIEVEKENEDEKELEWMGKEEEEVRPKVERQSKKLRKLHRKRALGPLKKFRKIRDHLGRLVKIVQE